MEISQNILEKLVRLLKGERIPASSLDYSLIKDLDSAQVIQKHGKKGKVMYYVNNPQLFESYLRNNHDIYHLKAHLQTLPKRKPRTVGLHVPKTLEGFFVTSYEAIEVRYNDEPFAIAPPDGIAIFITKYQNFFPDSDTTIVGVASAENFKDIRKQKHLFTGKKVLFTFEPLQSKDLRKWLQGIPNDYLHFCSYDFVSLNNYFSKYRTHLGSRCTLFIPTNFQKYLEKYGSTKLYFDQLESRPGGESLNDNSIQQVIEVMEKEKKGLEQKYFINLIDE